MPWQFNDEERPCARRGVELPWYPSRQGGFRRGVTDASGVMVVVSAVREGITGEKYVEVSIKFKI